MVVLVLIQLRVMFVSAALAGLVATVKMKVCVIASHYVLLWNSYSCEQIVPFNAIDSSNKEIKCKVIGRRDGKRGRWKKRVTLQSNVGEEDLLG